MSTIQVLAEALSALLAAGIARHVGIITQCRGSRCFRLPYIFSSFPFSTTKAFILPAGLPVSTTQVLTGAVLAVGLFEGAKGVNWFMFIRVGMVSDSQAVGSYMMHSSSAASEHVHVHQGEYD